MYIYNTIYNYYIHFSSIPLLIKADSNKFGLLSTHTPSTITYKQGRKMRTAAPPLFCCHACHASRFTSPKHTTTPTLWPHGTKRCASYPLNPRLTKSLNPPKGGRAVSV